ncbi:MAG: glycosyltransferase [Kineothrix sp.]
MGIWKVSNLKKAYYFFKKNGLKNAYYAALERMMAERGQQYSYEEPSAEELDRQRQVGAGFSSTFSVLVPAYETREAHLREMVDSLLRQSYGRWELIIADASESERVREAAESYGDGRIRCLRLEGNRGISENTNAALAAASGDYIGLLDHDDVLTPDALFEMARTIEEGAREGEKPWLLYSDEDKGNGELTEFYEPHFKPGLNLELLLSNNYICHFLVMRRELMAALGLRREYDGAQDYDLVLRAAEELLYKRKAGRESICHVSRVLYHWRCHSSSTAENPESKRYAYDAGRRAVEDFMRRRGWKGKVCDTLHLGFYRIEYEGGILSQRKEVGAVGGKLLDGRGRIAGGIYDEDGSCPYLGLPEGFSGYMHRASLAQEAYALDVRAMEVQKELVPVFEEVFGFSYENRKDCPMEQEKLVEACLEFGRRLRQQGYLLVWHTL